MSVRESRVLAANEAFYLAMRAGDLAAMEALWSKRAGVSCTHPGRPMLVGRNAVMGSWRAILGGGRPPAIACAGAVATLSGATAIVLCEERVMGARLMAVNTFALEGGSGAWRMVGHHAGEFA